MGCSPHSGATNRPPANSFPRRSQVVPAANFTKPTYFAPTAIDETQPGGSSAAGRALTSACPNRNLLSSSFLRRTQLVTSTLHLLVLHERQHGTTDDIPSTARDRQHAGRLGRHRRIWRALFAGTIVPLDAVAEMTRPRSADPSDRMHYGLGFRRTPDGAVEIEGYDAGVSFLSTHYPSDRRTRTVVATGVTAHGRSVVRSRVEARRPAQLGSSV